MNDLRRRLREKLNPNPDWDQNVRSDYDLNPDLPPNVMKLIPAAVLIPVIDRGHELSLLLTLRTEDMPAHPGQISLPGGKVHKGDRDAAHTALRETEEEVGIDHNLVDVVGFLDPYETRTGFCIMPVVGFVDPTFTLDVETREVAEVFEVPLAFLMDEANHKVHTKEWEGHERYYYAMPFQDYYIWGVTAGVLKLLYDKLYST